MIDAYASLRHYAEHLAPVWAALPAEARGTFWSPDHTHRWGQPLDGRRDLGRTVLVASLRDAITMGPSELVLVEHGAGQTYEGQGLGNGSYPGGRGHERVRLFVCPNVHVAEAWRRAYPATPAAVVGCPKLDPWHTHRWPTAREDGEPATVAVTFHWDCGLVPETRSAWRHYDRVLPTLVHDPRWRLLGHGHPRLWPTISHRWKQLGVELEPELAGVLDRADLLVGDNSSALPEFASLDRPVLCLNQPGYRRDVHHGGRFWDQVPGVQVDRAGDLADAIAYALTDPPEQRAMRARTADYWYAYRDGHAAERAAAAIMQLVT